MTKTRNGTLFVVSGPSGCGKSTLCSILTRDPELNLGLVVSHTSRPIRKTEENGREYYFLSAQEFEKKKNEGFFLESAQVHGNFYGTPRDQVENFLKAGLTVLLEIDVQGGLQVRQNFPEAVLVFVSPPTFETLKERLYGRGTDAADVIEKRIHNAIEELQQIPKYDYLVLNDQLDAAVEDLKIIFLSESFKVSRLKLDEAFATMRLPGYCERT